MRISFGELRIGAQARAYVQDALDRNWVSEGVHVAAFEREFAEHFGYRHAIATSSGTDAVLVACAALYARGAERGDEIITPACSFVATANAILAAGFVPRFVDVEPHTFNLDPGRIEAAVGPRTRAIMCVHTMGKPCDMDAVLDIAGRRGLAVIEDACEAHGATHRGRIVGGIGDLGAFSFYAAHLICCGEGGMVTTNDDALADVVRSVKSHGRPTGQTYFRFERFGTNSKLTELCAALGREGIGEYDQTFRYRRELLLRMLERTADLRDRAAFLVQEPHEIVAPHAFPIVVTDPAREAHKLYAWLEERGIQCKTLFGSLPTQHPAFAFLGHERGEFPVAEMLGERGLHFGCHQYLSYDDVDWATDLLHEWFERPS